MTGVQTCALRSVLVLQDRHVVADGGRGDAQAVALDQGARAHRFAGAHVVGDNGGEDLEATVD